MQFRSDELPRILVVSLFLSLRSKPLGIPDFWRFFCTCSRRLGAQAGLAAEYRLDSRHTAIFQLLSLRSKPLRIPDFWRFFCTCSRRLGAQAGLAAEYWLDSRHT